MGTLIRSGPSSGRATKVVCFSFNSFLSLISILLLDLWMAKHERKSGADRDNDKQITIAKRSTR